MNKSKQKIRVATVLDFTKISGGGNPKKLIRDLVDLKNCKTRLHRKPDFAPTRFFAFFRSRIGFRKKQPKGETFSFGLHFSPVTTMAISDMHNLIDCTLIFSHVEMHFRHAPDTPNTTYVGVGRSPGVFLVGIDTPLPISSSARHHAFCL